MVHFIVFYLNERVSFNTYLTTDGLSFLHFLKGHNSQGPFSKLLFTIDIRILLRLLFLFFYICKYCSYFSLISVGTGYIMLLQGVVMYAKYNPTSSGFVNFSIIFLIDTMFVIVSQQSLYQITLSCVKSSYQSPSSRQHLMFMFVFFHWLSFEFHVQKITNINYSS